MVTNGDTAAWGITCGTTATVLTPLLGETVPERTIRMPLACARAGTSIAGQTR